MSTNDPILGRQLANFRIERVIGRGGMATVYYGWDIKLERPVAIKVVDARYRSDAAYAQRFVNEARSVATWFHENILQVHYADDEDGLYYFVMEYVRGLDLGELLQKYTEVGEMMPHEDTLRIGRAVARALDFAHTRGVIHRDVKPSNVMISEDGRVALTDFGLAMDVAQGTSGEVFGSPHYVSPEQARSSAKALPQSDLYSLGVMLYEMLTGSVPFDDPSPTTLAVQHLIQPPPSPRERNPDLSIAAEKVLLKALSKKPEERYQSGNELMDSLEKALQVPEATSPLPAQHSSIALADSGSRLLSQVSASEHVANHMKHRPPTPSLAERGSQVSSVRAKSLPQRILINPFTWWGVGGCLTLLVMGILATWLISAMVLNGKVSPSVLAQSTSSEAAATSVSNSISLTPDQIGDPLSTLNPSQAQPTTTVQVPNMPASPSATPAPPTSVPAQPDGDYFVLYYDDTSLYFQNLSGKDRSIYPIAFERIENGQFTDRFEGWRWGEIYSNFRDGYCMVLEIINYLDHLDPPECKNKHLVIRTPTSDQPYIFWTSQEGSNQFRVLWDDQEITRCKIKDHFCEVYLP
jgi:serine/threonine protein kinase